MPFGIQPIHIIIVIAVALIIFGPSKLPEMGRGLGRAITEFRKGTQEMTQGFKDEIAKPVDEAANPPAAPVAVQPQAPAVTQPQTPFVTQIQAPAPVVASQSCPQCGSQNPADARFCNHCGAALSIQPN